LRVEGRKSSHNEKPISQLSRCETCTNISKTLDKTRVLCYNYPKSEIRRNNMKSRTEKRDVILYTCSDGMEFDNKVRAEDHESYVARVRIEGETKKEFFPEILGLYEGWTFVATKEQRDYYAKKDSDLETLKLGDWFTDRMVNSEDEFGRGETNKEFIILRDLVKDMRKFLDAVESKTVDGQY
jgi:hypothetical protein